VSFTVPAGVNPTTVEGETKRIEHQGEYKRVHFYKVDLLDEGKISDDGNELRTVVAKFRVLDNPLPLVPIAWGAAALVGVGGGSWLLFSSAESFVEESQWPILTAAASILSILAAYHAVFAQ